MRIELSDDQVRVMAAALEGVIAFDRDETGYSEADWNALVAGFKELRRVERVNRQAAEAVKTARMVRIKTVFKIAHIGSIYGASEDGPFEDGTRPCAVSVNFDGKNYWVVADDGARWLVRHPERDTDMYFQRED